MRMIERSTAFKRDYKRVRATPRYSKSLDSLLSDILELLLADKALPDKNCDHALTGAWNGYREIRGQVLNCDTEHHKRLVMFCVRIKDLTLSFNYKTRFVVNLKLPSAYLKTTLLILLIPASVYFASRSLQKSSNCFD